MQHRTKSYSVCRTKANEEDARRKGTPRCCNVSSNQESSTKILIWRNFALIDSFSTNPLKRQTFHAQTTFPFLLNRYKFSGSKLSCSDTGPRTGNMHTIVQMKVSGFEKDKTDYRGMNTFTIANPFNISRKFSLTVRAVARWVLFGMMTQMSKTTFCPINVFKWTLKVQRLPTLKICEPHVCEREW